MRNLPLGWELATLRDAALPGREGFIDGDWIEAPYITNAGIRLIQTGNLGVGTFIDKPETRKYISVASYRLLNCTSVNPGDVLICRLADPIGRACEIPDTIGDAITAVDCTITRVNQARYDKSFLLHWLNSEQNLKAAADRAAGSTRSRISRLNLGNLPLLRPPRVEQSAISLILSTLETTIRQAEAIIEKLKQVRQGLMHDLLTRGIDARGELRAPQSEAPNLYKQSEIGWIPREWQDHLLSELSVGGLSNGVFKEPRRVGSGVALVNVADLYRGQSVDLDSCERFAATDVEIERYGIARGDIFFTRSSLKLEGIAQASIVNEVPKGAVFECHVMRLRPNSSICVARFLKEWCASPYARTHFMRHAKQVTMTTISQDGISSLRCPVPPIGEQAEIVDRIAVFDQRFAAETEYARKARQMKAGLVDDLLTGRVRVAPQLD